MTENPTDTFIRELGLKPHPEGGMYAETWRDVPDDDSRGSGTAIYYMLRRGESSWKHRVDATEIWHHYAGGPLVLTLEEDGGGAREYILGTDFSAGERPQIIVPKGVWQSARPLSGWVLVGCTVSPAFEFEGFEMAPRP